MAALLSLSSGGAAVERTCGTGELHVQGAEVETREFPLKHTRVEADVSGFVSRTVVTQIFTNPYNETIEAVYVFPLPHDSAVTDFEMRMGERVIRGLIERREEARRRYEKAREEGKVSALLEEERPNIFTQSVANILPGNDIEITLTYVETLEYEHGVYEFVFPMVVGPRYMPLPGQDDVVPAGGERILTSVPDADRITPPYLPPTVRSGHDIELALTLDAGVPIRELESPSHAVSVARLGARQAKVQLSPLDTVPNKDFVFRYRVDGAEPEAGVLAHRDGRDGYVTVVVQPKADFRAPEITPKEMIFVVDCSGSMEGEPIAAAKGLVRHALANLNPGDTFQIIQFSMQASEFSPAPIEGTPANVRRGLSYIDQLAGEGGTEMIAGIRAALDTPDDPSRLRIVLFLTDGYVGNDPEILAAVRSRLRNARLFSLGVGSSVNRFLLDRMAEEGRGEVQYVLPHADAKKEIEKFYERIRSPYLTNVEFSWTGIRAEDVYPARVPDLFVGKPLIVHARCTQGTDGFLEVRGRLGGKPWTERVKVEMPKGSGGNPALASLWARAKISDLEREQVTGERPEIVEEITNLALAHRLVTRYTSFVAVEETIVVSKGRPSVVRVPLEMPEGVSYEGVFGEGFDRFGSEEVLFPPMGASLSPGRGLRALGYVAEERWGAAAIDQEAHKGNPVVGLPEPVRVPLAQSPAHWGDSGRSESDRAETLEIVIRAVRDSLVLGEEFVLEVTLRNTGSSTVKVPSQRDIDAKGFECRVIDGAWNVTRFGRGGLEKTEPLAPGASATRRVRLLPKAAPFLRKAGWVHLILEGATLGASDSNRITVRIFPIGRSARGPRVAIPFHAASLPGEREGAALSRSRRARARKGAFHRPGGTEPTGLRRVAVDAKRPGTSKRGRKGEKLMLRHVPRGEVAAALLLALALGGCSSLRIAADWDRDIDFHSYRSYKWAPIEAGEETRGTDRTLLDKRVRSAVDRELTAKGYTRAEDGPTDMLLVYRAKVRDKIDVYADYGYPRRWGRGVSIYEYREGTLAILIVDPKLDQVIWQGWAQGVVADPERSDEKIREAVRKVLKRFPPGDRSP
jgi:Ca-activated chloride channel family protein